MRLGIEEQVGRIDGLLEAEAPASDLRINQRPPLRLLLRLRVDAENLADVEVFVNAVIDVERGLAGGEPLLADAELDIIEVGIIAVTARLTWP